MVIVVLLIIEMVQLIVKDIALLNQIINIMVLREGQILRELKMVVLMVHQHH
jgi:hypothetical protein